MSTRRLNIQFRERQLAIVLLDLIGSTQFVQRVGARRAAEWLQYHDRLARSAVYRFEGREIDRSDGFLLSFERVIDAVNFSLYYQKNIPQKTKLQCRIGIHWGTVVEVLQDELLVGVGAKQVELEGVAKNIAARTMSICGAGQVLVTEAAMDKIKYRRNSYTPAGTRYALAGLYQFQGVREPVVLYCVGLEAAYLQPPKGNAKSRRIGGPKRIKSRAKHRKFNEWVDFLLVRLSLLCLVLIICIIYPTLINRSSRGLIGLGWVGPFIDPFHEFIIEFIIEPLGEIIEFIT